MRDPQATDEVSEAGPQPADKVPQVELKVTETKLKPEDLQAIDKLQPGGPKVSQRTGWVGPNPGACVLSSSGRLRGGGLTGISPAMMVVVQELLGGVREILEGSHSSFSSNSIMEGGAVVWQSETSLGTGAMGAVGMGSGIWGTGAESVGIRDVLGTSAAGTGTMGY